MREIHPLLTIHSANNQLDLHQWAPEYDAVYAQSGYRDPLLSIVFPLAMNHAVLLQSLVAMCRAFWLIARKRAWETDAEYIKHRGRALSLVQAKLNSEWCAENATLLAIVCLTSLEVRYCATSISCAN